MILSASRRTDIPAFFSRWFMNRLKEGYFIKKNPFNKNQKKVVPITPAEVDAVVFWSKYPRPLLKYLDEIEKQNYNYYFQFTLNNYPEVFEPNLPDLNKRLSAFKHLSKRLGPSRVIWRYDPIILSSKTPLSFHENNFNRLIKILNKHTQRVVISFLDIYGKTESKLNKLKEDHGIKVKDIRKRKKDLIELSKFLKSTADKYGLEIYTCAEESLNIIPSGKCIDDNLINDLFNLNLNLKKDPGQRDECRCVTSTDMGVYNTCEFACSYCYANYSLESVIRKNKKHNEENPSLI